MMNYYLVHELDHSWLEHPVIWVKSILYCSANPSKNTGTLSGSRLAGFRTPEYMAAKLRQHSFLLCGMLFWLILFLLWSIVFGLA